MMLAISTKNEDPMRVMWSEDSHWDLIWTRGQGNPNQLVMLDYHPKTLWDYSVEGVGRKLNPRPSTLGLEVI